MPIFAVIPLSDQAADKLQNVVNGLEEIDDYTKVFHLQNKKGFLVRYKGISKEISDALQISQPKPEDGDAHTINGPAIVLLVDGYWGYASGATWEWLRTYGAE